MNSAYDWITLLIFAGLVTRFLQQSAAENRTDASLWHYLIAAVGCGVANTLGNGGEHIAAAVLIVATLAYIAHFIFGIRIPNRRH